MAESRLVDQLTAECVAALRGDRPDWLASPIQLQAFARAIMQGNVEYAVGLYVQFTGVYVGIEPVGLDDDEPFVAPNDPP